MTFPFYSHRTLKEVEETRQLQDVWNAELRGGEPLTQQQRARYSALLRQAVLNNPRVDRPCSRVPA